MRRQLPGVWNLQRVQSAMWQIARSAPDKALITLRGVDTRTVTLRSTLAELEIEWHERRVRLTGQAVGRTHVIGAASAIVHEAAPALYLELPLTDFDGGARRFWRRVFWLMKFPGGRFLLRLMTMRRAVKPDRA